MCLAQGCATSPAKKNRGNFAKKGSPRSWRDDTRCLHQASCGRSASLCAPVLTPAKGTEPAAPRRRGPPAAMATPGWLNRASKTNISANKGGLTAAKDVGLVSGSRQAWHGRGGRCRPPHGVGQTATAARTSRVRVVRKRLEWRRSHSAWCG